LSAHAVHNPMIPAPITVTRIAANAENPPWSQRRFWM